jgi:uncharacterized protein (DUF1501 family)
MKRREFLKRTVPVAIAAPAILNGMPVSVFNGTNPLINLALAQQSTINDKVLVIIQLAGGNDGLNTVIPLEYYFNYQNARKNIAIPETKALLLKGTYRIGLHPSMTAMQRMYNDQELAIFNSVGYPNPNFSHFRSTDILMSASDSNVLEQTGWVGRYLDLEYPNFPLNYPNTQNPHPPAVQIGNVSSFEFQGTNSNFAYTIPNATSFYNVVANTSGTVPNNNSGIELVFLRMQALQSQSYTGVLQSAYNYNISDITNPPAGNNLYNQLKIIARLINGGLQTKVYHVTFGGFDNHDGQVDPNDQTIGTHANLLKKLSDAIGGFNDLLKTNNLQDKVLGMTFSEFGRRIKSNGSYGTDHGSGAPLFLFGSKVNYGIFGSTPTIPGTAKVNDNVPYQHDFRQVYTSILQQWFCLPPSDADAVLFKSFAPVSVIRGAACSTYDDSSLSDAENAMQIYPNPFSNATVVSFMALDTHAELEALNSYGHLIYKTVLDTKTGVMYEHRIDSSEWPVGTYYMRVFSSNKPIVKVAIKLGEQ